MATRSFIGKIAKNSDSVEYIYCHWDGYFDYNGLILKRHYKSGNKIDKLISLGALSVLKPKVSPKRGIIHTFNNPYDDVCVFYTRDRGEEMDKRTFNIENFNLCVNKDILNEIGLISNEMIKKSGDYIGCVYIYIESVKRWFCYESCTNTAFMF
jgi:hypothetical protein